MGCINCDNTGCNCDCSTPITIPTGADGVDGATGLHGGFGATWDFDTSTASGPVATDIRMNNASYASVSEIYISTTDGGSADVKNLVGSFDNDSSYGYIRLFKASDSTKYWAGRITGVADNSTDFTITVEYIGHNSAFVAADKVVAVFSPAGKDAAGLDGTDGADGADGNNGTSVILNDTSATSSTTATSFTLIQLESVSGGTLITDGDKLKVTCIVSKSFVKGVSFIRFKINNTAYKDVQLPEMSSSIKIEATITRKSNTQTLVDFEAVVGNAAGLAIASEFTFSNPYATTFNLDASSFKIEVEGYNSAVGRTLTMEQFNIDYYKKTV